nr:MAG TPA: hypothetical protein [Bacteriophage sp.]
MCLFFSPTRQPPFLIFSSYYPLSALVTSGAVSDFFYSTHGCISAPSSIAYKTASAILPNSNRVSTSCAPYSSQSTHQSPSIFLSVYSVESLFNVSPSVISIISPVLEFSKTPSES